MNASDGKTMSHFCLSLEGALAWPRKMFDRSFNNCIKDDGGRVLSVAEARTRFEALVAKGIKLIPYGECDNFDPDHGCKGHPVKEEVPA